MNSENKELLVAGGIVLGIVSIVMGLVKLMSKTEDSTQYPKTKVVFIKDLPVLDVIDKTTEGVRTHNLYYSDGEFEAEVAGYEYLWEAKEMMESILANR